MSMSWLATTPGKRLVMPCSSTAGSVVDIPTPKSARPWERGGGSAPVGPGGGRFDRPPGPQHGSPSLLGRRDLSGDDLLLEIVKRRRQVTESGGVRLGVVDTVVLQGEPDVALLDGAVADALGEVEHRGVDPLEHR